MKSDHDFSNLVSTLTDACRKLQLDGVALTAARAARELGRFGEHPQFMRAYREALASFR